MNDWARRRKRVIRLIFLCFLVVIIGVPYLLFSYKKPTCYDGKMNGGEGGIDCGGSCQLLCTTDSLPIIAKGDPRIIVLATTSESTVIQAVVEVENPNSLGELTRAPYVFKFWSGSSTEPTQELKGETYVPKQSIFVILEGPFEVKNDELPKRIAFEWGSNPDWKKNSKSVPNIDISNQNLTDTETKPRLTADLSNDSSIEANNIDLVAVILDGDGNIIAASRTFVESLEGGKSTQIVFTWPKAIVGDIAGTKIFPRIFPDKSYLK